MNEQTRKQLEELRGSANGQALILYLEEEIEKIKDISTIDSMEELQARQEAEKILKGLFKFLDFKADKKAKSKYN